MASLSCPLSRIHAPSLAFPPFSSPSLPFSLRRPARPPPLSCSASLYSVLGVPHDVTLSSIKSAYRQLAKVCHPDACPLSDAQHCTEMFLQVQEAYEVLSDPERRADYDYTLLHPLCAQALSKGFPSNVDWSPRRTRSSVRSEASAAWKLQWEAQLNRLKQKPAAAGAYAAETWGAKVRSRNLEAASVC